MQGCLLSPIRAVTCRILQKEGIEYDVLPGANAALTAYVASGFVDVAFNFFGFLPHKGTQRKEMLAKVLNAPIPSILYESPHRLLKLLEELDVLAPEREIFLAKELTKKFQTYLKTTSSQAFADLKDVAIKGEWVVVIDGIKESAKRFSKKILSILISRQK